MTTHPASDPGSSSANYDLLDRLADEFAERFRRGERPSLKEYTDRYPDLADDIQALFPALVDLEQAEEVRQEGAEVSTGAEPSTPAQTPAPALAQVGDYRVLREIGHGGMGVVYEAEQVSLGRRVALKILPRHVARDPRMLERFRREARAAARLHHTNIVPVFEVGREGDVCYYAMQFIQGQGLDLVYDELRRLRGRAKEKHETGARSHPGGTVTHADPAAVGQVVHSLLTGRFGDDPPPAPADTVAGRSVPERPTAVFARGSDPALDRTVAGSASGGPENVATPSPTPAAHASLAASSAMSAVMPGGSQISTVESDRREYARSVARIGLQAAQGLAYAHARGVIHRDIKPSNLLLDTAGVVWITDFGLAKAEGDALTQTGDVLGTLRYMAPERFSGGGDARADVYGLGLTLYELLTLEPAFDAADRLRLIEQIKSVDPARPRLVDRRLPRDLETVILKAIDKDARRRYQTADALAEDLRRFRDDEPILARRATAVERYARWARRNPGVAVLGGVLTAVLVLVTAASLLVAGRMATLAERQRWTADSERVARLAESDARQHEAALRKQAEQAKRDAEAALAETQVERNRAEENFQRARAVVDQYFTQVSESRLLSVPGLQTLRRDLLGSALSFYEDYLARRGRDPGLRFALAAVHLKAAKIQLELGDRAAAEKDYRGALALYQALAQADPAPEARSGLAECHYGLAMCGPAGNPRHDALLRSATIRQELVAAQPTDRRLREDLARSYQALGEGQLAAVVRTQPAAAGGGMSAQAQALSQQAAKQVKEALDWFLKARDIAASLVGDHPDDPAYRHDFARNLGEIAECLCKLGRHEDETMVRPMAIDHARAAYEQAPHEVAYGRLYGHLAMREGNNLASQDRYEESIRSLWQAVQVQEKLIRENPAVPDLPRELLTTYLNIGRFGLHQGGAPSDLVQRLRQACELIEGLPVRGPDQLYVLTQLLALRATKPEPSRPHDEDEARRRRDWDVAADTLRRAIAGGFGGQSDINALRNNARTHFPSLLARQDVAGNLNELEARLKADALVAQKTNPAPRATPNPNVSAARPVSKTQDADAAHRRLQADLAASERAVALIHFEMGTTLQKQGDFAAAVSPLQRASEHFHALRQELPGDPLLTRQHGINLRLLAVALRDSQRPIEALARAREGLAVDESLRDPSPGDLYNLAGDCALVSALLDHGATEDREKHAARAVGYLRSAIAGDPDRLLPQVPADHNLDPLRSRADFRDLMADASFPSDPFVPAAATVLPLKQITNSIGMKLVLIPAGEFLMGSPDSDKDAKAEEKPQHRVRITRPFYLGANEVTQGQYRAVTGANPSAFQGSVDLPVEQVSWLDAVKYCNALSREEGLPEFYRIKDLRVEVPDWTGPGYRLPTEAEWEYACRAGSTTRYCYGDDAARLGEYAWYVGNSGNRTHSVGGKRPNVFGLHDMYGNVWEWCWDSFGPKYFGHSPAADPLGPAPPTNMGVIRGGGWGRSPRSADRLALPPDYPGPANVVSAGFRVARFESRPTTDRASAGERPQPLLRVIQPQANGEARVENSPTKLVGQKAAPLAVEAWVNGSPVSDLDLKGKVVLLDFWAVWCGPCIATFPHLREWNEKYAGKGLVMIGLTDYHNYEWDEQAGKATRSADDVAPEKEQAMLVKFAAQHELTHRLGIQKEHGLSKYYGVTGIPQVVVIDRDGVIRLIEVGSGEANAKAIGELLATLLSPAVRAVD